MSYFSFKETYVEDGIRVLEVDILPEKHCNFDCIFCPFGRSYEKSDTQKSFGDIDDSLAELGRMMECSEVDLEYINSKGEALFNDRIADVIRFVKEKRRKVRLLSNGYVLNRPEYSCVASMCDEVIGEIRVGSNEVFQKIHRTVKEYTFEQHVMNMKTFRNGYNGRFILEITILKGYSEDDESVRVLKKVIKEISPDKVVVERSKGKLGISDERYVQVKDFLLGDYKKTADF